MPATSARLCSAPRHHGPGAGDSVDGTLNRGRIEAMRRFVEQALEAGPNRPWRLRAMLVAAVAQSQLLPSVDQHAKGEAVRVTLSPAFPLGLGGRDHAGAAIGRRIGAAGHQTAGFLSQAPGLGGCDVAKFSESQPADGLSLAILEQEGPRPGGRHAHRTTRQFIVEDQHIPAPRRADERIQFPLAELHRCSSVEHRNTAGTPTNFGRCSKPRSQNTEETQL
jgi:hypothetical protein